MREGGERMMSKEKFTSLEQFEQYYFPESCKKYPITIRVTKEEENLILQMRSGWRLKEK